MGRGQSGSGNFNPPVLAEIDLPNGTNYKFFYNAYGELDKVIYPTGGYERHQYNTVPTLGSTSIPYDQGSRGLVSRSVSPSGAGPDEAQWQYDTTLGAGLVVSVTAPDANGAPNGTRSVTYLYNNLSPTTFGFEDAKNGLTYEERIYAPASQGGAMLRRSLTDYAQSSQSYTRPSPGTGTYTAYRNARPIKTVSLILDTGGDALAASSTFDYDTTYQFTVGVDQTSSSQYQFATVNQTTAQTAAISSIPNGDLARTTQTSYLTSDANYRNRNILGLASSVTILNAASQIVAQSTFGYDEPSYPLLTYGSITGWIDPQTSYRGSVTTTSRWLDLPTPTWISSHAQYDQTGNVRYAWDPRGNQSSVSYSSSYAYAFPTQTSSAVPDPNNTYGTNTPLTASTIFDFNTGLVTSSTDANNQTTTYEYVDPLNRLTRVNLPDGGRTTHTYVDSHTCGAYVETRTLIDTGRETDAWQFSDGLGRPYLAESLDNQDPNNPYLRVDTQYDSLGRVLRVSNPYRTPGCTSAVNPSGSWTTNSYDVLSRVVAVTTPDGAQVTTGYSAVTSGSYIGPSVTVTDQAGKARKSISDAEGRVLQVIEDPSGLAYQTNYTYDALNNLRKVEQGSQFRFYGYDSLSRLIRIRTVEQTVNGALNWTDPVTGNASWTMALGYDANGNVTARVDARNITSTLAYDALNRAYSLSYSDGTPAVYRIYDFATNGRGRLYYDYSPSVSVNVFDAYDPMGRPTQGRQHFWVNGNWGTAFNVQRTYDKAGDITTQTYPSGHIANYTFDVATRTSSFTGNLGDGTSRTYSTGISYSPFGGMQQEQFGTATPIYNKRHYNVRGQLYDVRASTYSLTGSEFDWNRGCLALYYGGAGWGQSSATNNGDVTLQQHWVPADDSYSNYSYTQDHYAYDSLNRLNWTGEVHGGPWGQSSWDYAAAYNYDRYGNRTVDQSTWGVSHPNYTIDANTNHLVAPAGFAYGYDEAGNQNYDSYTGEGPRTFDAENHMKQAWAYNQWQTYTYDSRGQRIKRNTFGAETWQVYGMSGELLAEYSANAAPTSPQKEYGYRNGELLITASGPSCGVGYTGPKTWVGTDGHLGHIVGHAEGTNWAVYTGYDSSGHMVFGPYDTTFGQGHHTAQFMLMVDNNVGADVVATLDVVENLGNTTLAQRQIRRSDFTAANQWQTFTLQFDNPCFGLAEARVWWSGNTNTKFAQLTITPLNVATSGVQWLVTDQLGTPRIVLDQTGSLASVSRHDYLPFGEELYAGTGGRTTAQGYTGDSTRQHFTGYEADAETGLNFAQARYQSPVQGRFTSVDPLGKSANALNPQSFNRYSYVLNNPVYATDPTGMMLMAPGGIGSYDAYRRLLGWGDDQPMLCERQSKKPKPAPLQPLRPLAPQGEGGNPLNPLFDKPITVRPDPQDDLLTTTDISSGLDPVLRTVGPAAVPQDPESEDIVERAMTDPIGTGAQVVDWASKGVKDFGYAILPDYGTVGFSLPLMAGGEFQLSKDLHFYGSYNFFGITGGNYNTRKDWKLGFQFTANYFVTPTMSEADRDRFIQGPMINVTTGPIGGNFPLNGGPPAVAVGWPFTRFGVNVSNSHRIF